MTPPAGAGRAGSPQRRRPNALSIDVEDYFHVSAFADRFSRADWETLPQRLEPAMAKLLGLLDAHAVRATFFVLGWVAERYPGLVAEIVDAGHELASHGYAHVRVSAQTPEAFRRDVARTKALLEDLGGVAVAGYRAASFSITEDVLWAFEVLAEEGYRYSSSVYPIRHDHYGLPRAPRFPYSPRGEAGVLEIPLSTVRVLGRNLPAAGGGYFRLAPFVFSRWALRRLNEAEGRPAAFYLHPWELDPEQPRLAGLALKTRFRHYTNLGRMEHRLGRLLAEFAWDRYDRVFLDDADPRPIAEPWARSA
jgi:polysaccharide deacetylase family protein (PEP-CTERM system associated)